MVVHSGFVPQIYFKEWQHDRALEFWKAYMQDKPPAFTICVENVMEEEPYSLTRLAEELNQKNIRLCLDIGHANRQGDVPLSEWIEVMAPYISHVHIHNNNGIDDEHNALEDGTIEMTKILEKLLLRCEEKTTFTIESLDGRRSLEWLDKEGYLKG